MTAALKECRRCHEEKPVENFSANRMRRDGLHTWCRACASAYAKERYNDPKTGLAKRQRASARKSRIKTVYGIEYDLVLALYEKQEGACAICGAHGSAPAQGENHSVLVIDHDHVTGEVRGLLCRHCNAALGGFRDSVETIIRAAHYLLAFQ